MVADSGQGMAIMSPPDVQYYLATRARQGFNAIQWDIIVTGLCNPDRTNYTTLDGIAPFTGAKSRRQTRPTLRASIHLFSSVRKTT